MKKKTFFLATQKNKKTSHYGDISRGLGWMGDAKYHYENADYNRISTEPNA